jgi:hypothetical protein
MRAWTATLCRNQALNAAPVAALAIGTAFAELIAARRTMSRAGRNSSRRWVISLPAMRCPKPTPARVTCLAFVPSAAEASMTLSA